MAFVFTAKTFLEIAAVSLVVYGILNEDKMVNFERNVSRIIKRKIRMYRRRKAIEKKEIEKIRNKDLYHPF